MQIDKRIFIVGCPRSGTTLLQGMLAAHPRIFSLPETFFFAKVLPRSWLKRYLLWPAIKVRGHLQRLIREMGRDDLLPLGRIGLFQRDYHVPFVKVMDQMTTDAGKDIWVEKTPWHIYCIEEIRKRMPNAIFIHIVRDGRDMVASLYDATNRNPESWASLPSVKTFKGFSIKECVDIWNAEVAISMRWIGMPGHHLVRYEDIVSDPKYEMESLCNFIGIDFDERMAEPSSSFNVIVRKGEKWKARNAGSVSRGERLYDRVFNEEERVWIESHLNSYPVRPRETR